MDSIMNKVQSAIESRMNEFAQAMQNFINGPQADNATMAGKPEVAFALKTASVVPVQKTDNEWTISLSYNNEDSAHAVSEDISEDMSFYFMDSKNYVFG